MPKTKIDLVKVIQHDGELAVPKSLSLREAVSVLQREITYQEQEVSIRATIDGFVLDAANAFFQALKKEYGWVHNKPTPGFWGDDPPVLLTVPTGLNTNVQVPWGRLTIPGIAGWLQTSVEKRDGQPSRLLIVGQVLRKHEGQINKIVELTRAHLRENSVFRGKAFRLRWKDADGDYLSMPEPHFFYLNRQVVSELVFSREVESAIAISIFTPIERTEQVRRLQVPMKRGILLSGKFGTGKSMTSTAVAAKAVDNGWTYILCERADELGDALRLAREYAPAVVFCEDIDRVMSGRRSVNMDEVLNIIDGVESKGAEVMVILTTNDVSAINRAMLRPGRLDDVIEVKPPDAEAAERLMRLYGRGLIAVDEDISAAGQMLDGEIPAVIQEVVERSKLAAIYRDPDSDFGPGAIKGEDLVAAAHSMRNQLELLKEPVLDTRSERVKAAQITAEALRLESVNGQHERGKSREVLA
jgi:transitional endoplasmic reticulum ATPase